MLLLDAVSLTSMGAEMKRPHLADMCSPDSCESKGMFNCYSVSTNVLWQQRAWFQIRYYQIKVAARRGGLDCIVIAKVMWQQGEGV